jgi:hypothetical protein
MFHDIAIVSNTHILIGSRQCYYYSDFRVAHCTDAGNTTLCHAYKLAGRLCCLYYIYFQFTICTNSYSNAGDAACF